MAPLLLTLLAADIVEELAMVGGSRRALVGFFVCVAVVFGVSTAGVASPSSSASSSSKYFYRLLRVAQAQLNYGAAIQGGKTTLTIFGVGYPTAKLAMLIKDAPDHGVTAHWRRCPYTQAALTDEAARLIDKYDFISQVGPSHRAFALIVGTTKRSLLASHDPERYLGTTFAVKVFRQGPAESFKTRTAVSRDSRP